MIMIDEITLEDVLETRRSLPDGWRWVRLGEVCKQDRQMVAPGSHSSVMRPYLGLEHIESNTGRILKEVFEAAGDAGKSTTFAFDPRHILYGKLRPYLNKVALPDFIGRCTTELIPLLPDNADRTFLSWVLRRQETIDAAMREKTGSRMPRTDMDDLLDLLVPLPPLSEQRRIAAILTEQMAAVERARAAAQAQLVAARMLPAAYLRAVFDSAEAQGWPMRPLNEVCQLLPSKSIASDGDTEVRAITTGCLSESGFLPSGIKTARMWARDAAQCKVMAGEILVARSNTPDLVGRAAMFSGIPQDAVASDLTIRIWPGDAIDPGFLAGYLSSLYLSGYWKERAGGASGSMKKITRTQIQNLGVPVPSLSEQREIAMSVAHEMQEATRINQLLKDQLDAIGRLPGALLRRAFSGEL